LRSFSNFMQNLPLLEIAQQYGTPIYVYDGEKMKENFNRLSNAFSGAKVNFLYACKALTNINILRHFKSLGAGIDAVSIEEVQLALQAGFVPDEIMFTPNCVSFKEIQTAVSFKVKINIDNISVLEHFGHEYGNTYPVCIRINPHILAGGNYHISTGHIDSKFGISIYQLRHVHRVIQSEQIKVSGLHMHTGSDILDADVFLRGADILFDLAKDFKELEFIDFGSGFKVAYKPNDNTTDVDDLGKKLCQRFNEFNQTCGKELQYFFEPGKFLVSEAGYLLVRCNVVKQTTSTVFAGVDSGFNHLIRPMFYNSYHQIKNISNPNGKMRIYTVVGNICETDTFGWDRKLNEVHEGDVLAILNAGAYGYMMASNYNSRPRPAEVFVNNGKFDLIRRRETLEDLLRGQVVVD